MSGREITLLMKFKEYTVALYDDNGYYQDEKSGDIETYLLNNVTNPEDILQHIDKMDIRDEVLCGNTTEIVFIDFIKKEIHRICDSRVTNRYEAYEVIDNNPSSIMWQDKQEYKTIYKIDNKYFDMLLENGLKNENKVREAFAVCKYTDTTPRTWKPTGVYYFNMDTAYKYIETDIPKDERDKYFVNCIWLLDWEEANIEKRK